MADRCARYDSAGIAIDVAIPALVVGDPIQGGRGIKCEGGDIPFGWDSWVLAGNFNGDF